MRVSYKETTMGDNITLHATDRQLYLILKLFLFIYICSISTFSVRKMKKNQTLFMLVTQKTQH